MAPPPACVGGACEVLAAGRADSLVEERRYLEAVLGLDPNCELASAALQRILLRQQTATHLHSPNAKAIAEFAEEAGAEVLRGALRSPSESGGWQLGDIDLSECLAEYQDCSLVVSLVFGP